MRPSPAQSRRAFASMLSILFLAMMCALSFAFFSQTNLELQKSENFQEAADARLGAESGLRFLLYHLKEVRLPADTTEATFAANLRSALALRLDGTANLDGATVQSTADAVFVPEIHVDESSVFHAWIKWAGSDRCRLEVTSSAHGLSRYTTIDLVLTPRLPGVFEYGMASRGQIEIGGSTRIVGVNSPDEADVFSAIMSQPGAISITSSAVEISGDLFLAADPSYVTIQGSPSIGGTTDPDAIDSHIHCGMEPPDFPELNTAPLVALATNVVDASTDTSVSGQTFDNIRIAPDTNPVFASDVVVNGVIYVEAPNTVSFTGHATVNGIIVTEDSDQPIASCQITFAGTADANGVEALPDTPEFAEVKQHTGTFILAPGFGVNFQGDANTIQGSLAADQITFSGNSGGTVQGTLIGLADLPTILNGHVEIFVDKSTMDTDPAGFVKPLGLAPAPDSYRELTAAP